MQKRLRGIKDPLPGKYSGAVTLKRLKNKRINENKKKIKRKDKRINWEYVFYQILKKS